MPGRARPKAEVPAPDWLTAAARVSLHQGLGFRLGRVQRRLRVAWAARIADLEIAPPQAAVLRALAERPGLGVRALARDIGTDPMNVKHLADALEARGLISSRLDPSDRRTRCLRLSPDGSDLSEAVDQRAQLHERWLLDLLGDAPYARLGHALDNLEAKLSGAAVAEVRDGD